MEKLKEYKYIILIVLMVLGGAFYWFQIRPAQIVEECFKKYPSLYGGGYGYQGCLKEHGLER